MTDTSSYDPTQDTGQGTGSSSPDTSGFPALGSSSTQQPRNPLGVPYYETDPSTGMPKKDAQGNPVQWKATVDVPAVQSGHWYPTQQQVAPRYFEGAQYAPATAAPDDIAVLQRMMIQAGLLNPGQALLGRWDKPTVDAYTQVLEYANRSGTDWSTALSSLAQSGATQGPKAAKRQPLVVDLSNPDDLKASFQQAFMNTYGVGVPPDKLNQMVAAYQQMETASQQQRYAMTGFGTSTEPGPGGTITAPPSPTNYATTVARQENPGLAQEHDALGMVNQFQNMVGAWSKVK